MLYAYLEIPTWLLPPEVGTWWIMPNDLKLFIFRRALLSYLTKVAKI